MTDKKKKVDKKSGHNPEAISAHENRPQDPSEDSTIRVVDRRFWVKKDWDPADKSASRLPSVLEKLESSVIEKEKKIEEVRHAALTVRQESESFRQRLQRDVDRKVDIAKGQIVGDLLELLDNLERSVAASKAGLEQEAAESAKGSPSLKSLEGLIHGLDLVCALFHEKLARHGVKKMDVLQKPYNPETAEALDVERTADPNLDNVVLKVLQDGYSLNGRTLRAARVIVGRIEEKKALQDAAPLDSEEEII